jgi:hypothetical protein
MTVSNVIDVFDPALSSIRIDDSDHVNPVISMASDNPSSIVKSRLSSNAGCPLRLKSDLSSPQKG